MAWSKKIPTMTIKGAGKGLTSITKAPGGAALTMPHPNLAHLQDHIGKVFGPAKPAKASSIAAGTPRSASSSGGEKVSPSPMMAQIASSMSGGN